MSHHTVGVRSLTSAKQHSPAGGPQVPVLIINFIFKQSSQFVQGTLHAIRAFEHCTSQIGGLLCSQKKNCRPKILVFIQKNNNLLQSFCQGLCYPDVQVKYLMISVRKTIILCSTFPFRLMIIPFIFLFPMKSMFSFLQIQYMYIHLNVDLNVYFAFANEIVAQFCIP